MGRMVGGVPHLNGNEREYVDFCLPVGQVTRNDLGSPRQIGVTLVCCAVRCTESCRGIKWWKEPVSRGCQQ